MLKTTKNKGASFHRTKLTIATSLAILLVGCGGSSSENTIEPTPEPPTPLSFSGKAADGYLKGALVCLDLNNNSTCDSDEPNAITGTGGSYSFDNLEPTLDLSMVRLLVKVIAGETIDEDYPDTPITQNYSLSSPPGQIDFVSPITTLIDNQMQNTPGQSQADATAIVAQLIGIDSDSNIDLTSDYVAGANSETSAKDYQRLHHVAQAVATSISVVQANLQSQLDNMDDSRKKDAINAIISNVVSGLSEITAAIDLALENGEEVKINQIVESIRTTIEIAQEEFEHAIDSTKDHREAQEVNLKTILTEHDGIFVLEQDKEMFYNAELNKCIIESEVGYSNFKVTDNIAEFSFNIYNPDTKAFELEQEYSEEEFSVYTLSAEGWTAAPANQKPTVSFSDDGTNITITMPRSGTETFSAREFELSGKQIASIASEQWIWQEALSDSDSVFSNNSRGYIINGELTQDHYIVPNWQGCIDATGSAIENCNTIRFGHQGEIATQLSQLITKAEPNEENILTNAFTLHFRSEQQVHIALFEYGELTEIKQIAKFFKANHECSPDQLDCQTIEYIGASEWKIETIQNVEIVMIAPPHWLSEFDEHDDEVTRIPFLTVQDGQVRQGVKLHSGITEHNLIGINASAMADIIAGFNPQALRIELDPEYCGIESSEPETAIPPQLTHDFEIAKQLIGKQYFIKDEHEQILVRFEAESMIKVVSLEQTSNGPQQSTETGEWLIDSSGILLLTFEQDWLMLNITNGLGTETMIATEHQHDQVSEIVFNQLTPLSTTMLPRQLPLTIFRDQQCSLSLHLQASDSIQGSGFVDASQCLSISEEMSATQFEVLWNVGPAGELVLQTISSIGEAELEKIHLWSVTINDAKHVLMTFEQPIIDQELPDDNFELWVITPSN